MAESKKVIMLGNEAIARGAYEAGVKVSAAYPGTPSTEISEYLVQYKEDLYCEWSPNEKVATEVAVGASIAGTRAMSCMKHVGFNVAADPAYSVSYMGVSSLTDQSYIVRLQDWHILRDWLPWRIVRCRKINHM